MGMAICCLFGEIGVIADMIAHTTLHVSNPRNSEASHVRTLAPPGCTDNMQEGEVADFNDGKNIGVWIVHSSASGATHPGHAHQQDRQQRQQQSHQHRGDQQPAQFAVVRCYLYDPGGAVGDLAAH